MDTPKPPAAKLHVVEKVTHIATKHPSGTTWTPQMLLEEFLAEIQAGRIDLRSCVLHFQQVLPSGRIRHSRWQANCSRAEEIAYATMAIHDAIEDWKAE